MLLRIWSMFINSTSKLIDKIIDDVLVCAKGCATDETCMTFEKNNFDVMCNQLISIYMIKLQRGSHMED